MKSLSKLIQKEKEETELFVPDHVIRSVVVPSASAEPGSLLVNSMLCPGAKVLAGAIVIDSIVGQNVVVPSGVIVIGSILNDVVYHLSDGRVSVKPEAFSFKSLVYRIDGSRRRCHVTDKAVTCAIWGRLLEEIDPLPQYNAQEFCSLPRDVQITYRRREWQWKMTKWYGIRLCTYPLDVVPKDKDGSPWLDHYNYLESNSYLDQPMMLADGKGQVLQSFKSTGTSLNSANEGHLIRSCFMNDALTRQQHKWRVLRLRTSMTMEELKRNPFIFSQLDSKKASEPQHPPAPSAPPMPGQAFLPTPTPRDTSGLPSFTAPKTPASEMRPLAPSGRIRQDFPGPPSLDGTISSPFKPVSVDKDATPATPQPSGTMSAFQTPIAQSSSSASSAVSSTSSYALTPNHLRTRNVAPIFATPVAASFGDVGPPSLAPDSTPALRPRTKRGKKLLKLAQTLADGKENNSPNTHALNSPIPAMNEFLTPPASPHPEMDSLPPSPLPSSPAPKSSGLADALKGLTAARAALNLKTPPVTPTRSVAVYLHDYSLPFRYSPSCLLSRKRIATPLSPTVSSPSRRLKMVSSKPTWMSVPALSPSKVTTPKRSSKSRRRVTEAHPEFTVHRLDSDSDVSDVEAGSDSDPEDPFPTSARGLTLPEVELAEEVQAEAEAEENSWPFLPSFFDLMNGNLASFEGGIKFDFQVGITQMCFTKLSRLLS